MKFKKRHDKRQDEDYDEEIEEELEAEVNKFKCSFLFFIFHVPHCPLHTSSSINRMKMMTML